MWGDVGVLRALLITKPFLFSVPSSFTLYFLLKGSIASTVTSCSRLLNLSVSNSVLCLETSLVFSFSDQLLPTGICNSQSVSYATLMILFWSETTISSWWQLPQARMSPGTHLVLLACVATFNTHWAPFLHLRKTILRGPWTCFLFFPSISFLIVPPVRNAVPLLSPLFFRYIFTFKLKCNLPKLPLKFLPSKSNLPACPYWNSHGLISIPVHTAYSTSHFLPYLIGLHIPVCILPSDESVSSLRLAHSAMTVQGIHLVDAWMNGWMDDLFRRVLRINVNSTVICKLINKFETSCLADLKIKRLWSIQEIILVLAYKQICVYDSTNQF